MNISYPYVLMILLLMMAAWSCGKRNNDANAGMMRVILYHPQTGGIIAEHCDPKIIMEVQHIIYGAREDKTFAWRTNILREIGKLSIWDVNGNERRYVLFDNNRIVEIGTAKAFRVDSLTIINMLVPENRTEKNRLPSPD